MDECGIYGVIQAEDTLSGKLDGIGEIQGRLDTESVLIGSVGFPKCTYPTVYDGTYDVIPKARTMQTLETNRKYMEDDVRVHEIPYYETSNEQGTTVYIANEL